MADNSSTQADSLNSNGLSERLSGADMEVKGFHKRFMALRNKTEADIQKSRVEHKDFLELYNQIYRDFRAMYFSDQGAFKERLSEDEKAAVRVQGKMINEIHGTLNFMDKEITKEEEKLKKPVVQAQASARDSTRENFPLDIQATNSAVSYIDPVTKEKTTFATSKTQVQGEDVEHVGRIYTKGSGDNIGQLTATYDLTDFEDMSVFKSKVREKNGDKLPGGLDINATNGTASFKDPNGISISTFSTSKVTLPDGTVRWEGRVYRGGFRDQNGQINIGQREAQVYDLTDPAERAMFEEKVWTANNEDPTIASAPRGTQTLDAKTMKITSVSGQTPQEVFTDASTGVIELRNVEPANDPQFSNRQQALRSNPNPMVLV